MSKKRKWTFVGLGLVLVTLLGIIYWFYFTKPSTFPSNEQLVEEINSIFPDAAASVIQDTIPADKHHVLVPFISDKGDYGLSYWIWQRNKWRAVSIDTKGTPMVWKIDRNDPSTYQFVWNIHPDDQISSIHYYLIRERGYLITEGIEHYYPGVQMEKKISLDKKSYGMLPLPKEWVTFMNAFINVESSKQPDMFSKHFFPEQFMLFGWIPYNQAYTETMPERSFNGSGYSTGKIDLEHLMILNKEELEISQ